MVKDNTEPMAQAAGRERARKEVTFDLTAMMRPYPQGDAHRVTSMGRRSSLAKSVQETARSSTMRQSVAGEEEFRDASEEPDSTHLSVYEQYQQNVVNNQTFKDSRYTMTMDELREDVRERVLHLGETHLHGNQPAFPFSAGTNIGKNVFSHFNGPMDQEAFDKAYSVDRKALFQEVKMRALLALAWDHAGVDLHRLASVNDTNLDAMATYVEEMNEETKEKMEVFGEQISDMLDEQKKEKERLAEANQTIADLVVRNRLGTPGSVNTAATGTSEAAAGRKKSAKVEVSTFYNDTEKDKVADDLQPYLDQSHPDNIASSEDLLAHLKQQYEDPNKKQKSRAEFAALEMKNLSGFQNFKNEFHRLAGEKKLPRDEWKEEFYQRLTPRVKNQVLNMYLDENVTYKNLVSHTEQLVHNLSQTDTESKNKKQTGQTSGSRSTGGTGGSSGNSSSRSSNRNDKGTTSQSAAKTGAKVYPKPNFAEMQELMKLGKCFTCHERGHRTRDCPLKGQTTNDQEREARLASTFVTHGNGERTDGENGEVSAEAGNV
ncbi:hypothetical protein GGS24DRAFT_199700 [Hypoxylon argillaceum]|nr:hypothetical protein GGS24DRAFT_199700 [Hypoxylon argillaceum]